MVRNIDIQSALYGIHYDLGEKLKASNNAGQTLVFLENRVKNLRKNIDDNERWKSGSTEKKYVRRFKKVKVTTQAELDRRAALWGDD